MFIGVQINIVGFKNQGFEDIFEFMIPVNRFYSGNSPSFIFAVFMPLPQRDLCIGFLHKQDFPVLFFLGIRADHQSALLLNNTA